MVDTAAVEQLIDSVAAAVVFVDAGGRILSMNKHAGELFEHTDEKISRSAPLFLHELFNQPSFEVLCQNLQQPQQSQGRYFCVQLKKFGEQSWLATVTVVSQQQADESIKHDFIDQVLQRLRTPLTSLSCSLQALCSPQGKTADIAEELIPLCLDETLRLSHYLDDLRQVLYVETGLLEKHFEPEVIDVERLISGAIIDVNDRIGITIPPAVSFVGDYTAYCDFEAAKRVLFELIKNAYQYGNVQMGHPVKISVYGSAEQVEIRVEDNGPGIATKVVPYIYEKYYRGDNALRLNPKGNGLGLYIASAIAKRLGGQVNLSTTTAQKGSCFQVHFPGVLC